MVLSVAVKRIVAWFYPRMYDN